MTFCLKITNHRQFSFRCCLSKKVIHSGLGCNRSGSHRIVPCNHNGLNSHFPKICKFFLNALLDNIFQMNDSKDFMIFCNNQRGSALFCYILYNAVAFLRVDAACLGNISLHRFCCTLPNFIPIKVYTAHSGFCCKWDKNHMLIC